MQQPQNPAEQLKLPLRHPRSHLLLNNLQVSLPYLIHGLIQQGQTQVLEASMAPLSNERQSSSLMS